MTRAGKGNGLGVEVRVRPGRARAAAAEPRAALPNVIVIGAMKCGTSALHGTLARHPEVAMSVPKELNFFFGPATAPRGVAPAGLDDWAFANGNWHRGVGWYAAQFHAGAPVRGESSPGYTSPDHPEVAARMAQVVPTARLVYLVRDPVQRAVSQYVHHRRDGTEPRPLEAALLDPASQYVLRGRYHERLEPFLARFGRAAIHILAQEELVRDRRASLAALLAFVGLDADPVEPAHWRPTAQPPVAARLRGQLVERLRDDAERLRALAGRDFPGWSL